MTLAWPPEVERVADFLRRAGAEARIEELERSAATAEDAADAVGSTLAQIVKTLVFMCDGAAVLALVPGDCRADSSRIARCLAAKRAAIATPDEVVKATGFAPGGVAPVPGLTVQETLVERTLLRHAVVWAGAGTERHLVRLAPGELVRLTRGRIEDIVRPSA